MSFLFSQEEIIHISKTHRDGTPKEVIIYEIVNDDLQSNNPFEIVLSREKLFMKKGKETLGFKRVK